MARSPVLTGVLLAAAVTVVIVATTVLALYPPTAFDSTCYHLTFAKAYARAHHIEPMPSIRFPVFPVLNETWFTALWIFGGDAACQLIEVAQLALVVLALFSWGRRLGLPFAGQLAAIFVIHSPIVLFVASSAYVDAS